MQNKCSVVLSRNHQIRLEQEWKFNQAHVLQGFFAMLQIQSFILSKNIFTVQQSRSKNPIYFLEELILNNNEIVDQYFCRSHQPDFNLFLNESFFVFPPSFFILCHLQLFIGLYLTNLMKERATKQCSFVFMSDFQMYFCFKSKLLML